MTRMRHWFTSGAAGWWIDTVPPPEESATSRFVLVEVTRSDRFGAEMLLRRIFANASGIDVNHLIGVILTSRRQNFDTTYSYTAVKKWNFGAHAGIDGNKALGANQGVAGFASKRAGGGATYQLRKFLFLNMQLEFQKFSGANLPLLANQRNQLRASIGLSFSPGDQPLAFR